MTEVAIVELLWVLAHDALWIVAAVVGYGLLRCALITATHQFRTRTGMEADSLAADARVGRKSREFLVGMADMAYHPFTPWLVIVGMTVGLFAPSSIGERMIEDIRASNDPTILEDLLQLKARLCVALMTTSLLVTLLAIPVLIVGLLVRASTSRLLERLAAAPVPGLRRSMNAA